MPRSGSFSASLARAESLLDELGLIENVNAWPDYSMLSASLCRTMTYVDLWRKCVTERLYDFGLINGSLFQFVESPTDSYSFLVAPILPKSFDDFAAEQMGEPWMMENGNDVEMFSMLRDEYESTSSKGIKRLTFRGRFDTI
jgi:hypothetical protein